MRPIGPFTEFLRDVETIYRTEWLSEPEKWHCISALKAEFLGKAHEPFIAEIVKKCPELPPTITQFQPPSTPAKITDGASRPTTPKRAAGNTPRGSAKAAKPQ